MALRFLNGTTHEDFTNYSAAHPELVMEREPDGEITIMSPVHLKSGSRESRIGFYLSLFVLPRALGEVYSPSTGFTLPDGSVRSADAAFVSQEKLDTLSEEELNSFARIVPVFVVEVRSNTDQLGKLQTKMQATWIDNGVRLAWLIDPRNEISYIYRADGSEEVVAGFDQSLSGEDVLPEFVFELDKL